MTFLRRAPFIRRRTSASGILVNITNKFISSEQNGPGTATSAIQYNNNGVSRTAVNGTTTVVPGEWLVVGSASAYSILANNQVGLIDPTGPALDTWFNLGTSREWSISASGDNIQNSVFDVYIRLDSTGQILDSATISLDATSSTGA